MSIVCWNHMSSMNYASNFFKFQILLDKEDTNIEFQILKFQSSKLLYLPFF